MSLSRSKRGHIGFILDLPFDIVTMIFSYLDQKDCLRCMGVSRTWNKHIPQYSRSIWKSVRFSKGGFEYLEEPEAEADKNIDTGNNALVIMSNMSRLIHFKMLKKSMV